MRKGADVTAERVRQTVARMRRGMAWHQVALTLVGLMAFFGVVLGLSVGEFLPVVGDLFRKAGLVGTDYEALMAMRAVTYATNCSAYANAWNPSTADSDNWVAEKYRQNCGVADVAGEGDPSTVFGVERDGELAGKKFGDTTVQCYMSPNDPKSGCNIYNLTLPQTFETRTGFLPDILESSVNMQKWIGLYESGYGDPKHLLYYGKFPAAEAVKWDSRKMSDRFSYEALLVTFAIEAGAGLIPGGSGIPTRAGVRSAIGGLKNAPSMIYRKGRTLLSNARYAGGATVGYMRTMGGWLRRRIASESIGEATEEGPARVAMRDMYEQLGVAGRTATTDVGTDAAAAVDYFGSEAADEWSTAAHRNIRRNIEELDNIPGGDTDAFAEAVQGAWTSCGFRGSCTAAGPRHRRRPDQQGCCGGGVRGDTGDRRCNDRPGYRRIFCHDR